jgi:DNA repair exonuclease SbcCD ATPase subunit
MIPQNVQLVVMAAAVVIAVVALGLWSTVSAKVGTMQRSVDGVKADSRTLETSFRSEIKGLADSAEVENLKRTTAKLDSAVSSLALLVSSLRERLGERDDSRVDQILKTLHGLNADTKMLQKTLAEASERMDRLESRPAAGPADAKGDDEVASLRDQLDEMESAVAELKRALANAPKEKGAKINEDAVRELVRKTVEDEMQRIRDQFTQGGATTHSIGPRCCALDRRACGW